ncbi:MAG TPA: peptidoglycan-binding domain-containing protein [Stellaceae bacterium]|nr:peptidoglycan-binding domain-containing protein [Stellaceae bacterium]
MAGRIVVVAASVGLSLAVSACGETQGERGLSGAAIGAGAGAVIGAVTPIGPAGGALIGGAAGAATGVLTTPSQGNMGKPVYRSSTGGSAGNSTVRDIQAGLAHLGYDPGPADGRMGPKTSAAIRKYQQDNGMAVNGQASQAVLDSIRAKG